MDAANKQVISIVKEYLENVENTIAPWQGYRFSQVSYTKWAAIEILYLLKEKYYLPPLTVLEDFANKMDTYACLNKGNTFMFSVAYDTTMNIIDILIK